MPVYNHAVTKVVDAAAIWTAATAYVADQQFSVRIPATGTYLDILGKSLANTKLYNLAYPTGQTSGATFDVAEAAKAESIQAIDETEDNFAKNTADFTSGNLTLAFFQDDPMAGVDGKYYPDLTPTADFTFPSVASNNGKRILLSTDWVARAVAAGPPNWITAGAETLDLPATGWPAEGTEFVWAIADETNSKWLVRTGGNVELSYVVPSFANDVDAAAATVAGSLFQGTGAGDLTDALYRVKADLTRVQV